MQLSIQTTFYADLSVGFSEISQPHTITEDWPIKKAY